MQQIGSAVSDRRRTALAFVTLYVFSSLCLYSVARTPGLIALGIGASAYCLPLIPSLDYRRWILVWAAATPAIISFSLGVRMSHLASNAPTSGAAYIWLGCIVAFPLLVHVAAGGAVSDWRRRGARWPATIVAIVVVAAVLRMLAVDRMPFPFSGDEATFTRIGLEREAGAPLNLFGSGFFGSSNLYFQLLAWAQLLPFDAPTNSRVLSGLFGSGAVALTFLFGRASRNVSIGVSAAAALALLHSHIHFSRVALPNVDETLVSAAVFFSGVWALHRRTPTAFAIAGLVCGLSPFAWTTARVVPVAAVLLFVTALIWTNDRRQVTQGALVFLAGVVVAASPLLLWWREHPEEFRTREVEVAVFSDPPGPRASWYEEERDRGESFAEISQGQFRRGWQAAFNGPEVFYFNSEIGVFGTLPSLLLLVGFVVAVRNIWDPANLAVLGLFGAVFVAGALLTTPPASGARLTGLLVPGAYLIALGADRLARIRGDSAAERQGQFAVAIVVLSCLPGLFYYFGEWRTERRFSDANTVLASEVGSPGTELEFAL